MMDAVEQQVLPSQGDDYCERAPGGQGRLWRLQAGPTAHQIYGAPGRVPSVDLGSISRAAKGVAPWASSLACPPTTVLIASRVPEIYNEALPAFATAGQRARGLLEESRPFVDATKSPASFDARFSHISAVAAPIVAFLGVIAMAIGFSKVSVQALRAFLPF